MSACARSTGRAQRLRIAALARKEQSAEAPDVVVGDQPALGIRTCEDVQRIGRVHRDAAGRLDVRDGVAPLDVASADELRLELRPLQHDAALRLLLDERAREPGDGVTDLAVRESRRRLRDRPVADQRAPVAVSRLHVSVERVVTGIRRPPRNQR
jgi:hypothetical protein